LKLKGKKEIRIGTFYGEES